MNKRGITNKQILWASYIILVIVMTYFLYTFINDVATGKGFSKKYSITDLGLTFDALSSANHDLDINYRNLDGYIITLSQGNIKINDEVSQYNYAFDNNIMTFSGNLEIKENQILLINKQGDIISVSVKENEVK